MAKLLGLDVGDKRVGVAITDLRGKLARPLGTFNRTEGEAEKSIIELLRKESVAILVVGVPLSDDGAWNDQCEKARRFARRIRRRADVEVRFTDEYLSTEEAKQRLSLSGAKKEILARGTGIIDAVSASIILQAYVENRSALLV